MSPRAPESVFARNVLPWLKRGQAVLGLLLILVVFSLLSKRFLSAGTFRDIVKQATVLGILACGTTVVLISGGLDLSVGSMLALVSVCLGDMMVTWGVPWPAAVALALGLGALCGCVNGLIQVWTGIPAFIVTLGGLMAYRGLAELLAAGKDLSGFAPAFTQLGTSDRASIGALVATALAVWVFLSMTRLGFSAYAVGGNEEVARLSGVNVKRSRVVYYTIGGMCAALAAVVQVSRVDVASSTYGQMLELYAIASVVIGGTSLFGGMGGVGRTIIGVLIIQSIRVGLTYQGVGSSHKKIAIGIIIVLAVWLDVFQRRRARKA